MPGTTDGHDGHNFVATVSALDLQNQTYSPSNDWQSANIFYNVDNQIQNAGQVNGNTLLTSSLSPFDAVMTSTSDCGPVGCNAAPYWDEDENLVYPQNNSQWNHYHNTSITSQTAQFIERNILGVQPIDCAGGNGLCNSNPSISGPGLICTSGQYQLTDPPDGVTINWEMQNGKLKIKNGRGTPASYASKYHNGPEVVIVTLTNTCGTSIVLTKNIDVGGPTVLFDILTYFPFNATCFETGAFYIFRADLKYSYNEPPALYQWGYRVTGTTNETIVNGSGQTASFLFSNTGTYDILVRSVNDCGIGSTPSVKTIDVVSMCWGGFKMSAFPNPTSSFISVTIDEDATPQVQKTGKSEKVIFQLYETGTTNLVKRWSFAKSAKSYQLSVSGIKQGQYILVGRKGKRFQSKQIVIVH